MGEEILYQVKVDGYCDYEDENVVVSIQREKCNNVCKIGVVGDED